MRRPAFQFYPADWRKDAAVQSCSLAAQGLWINLMCIAHECAPYGHLIINGKAMQVAQLARLIGITTKECDSLLSELHGAGVFSISDGGVIFSRRMVKDEATRNARAAGGKLGGNPALMLIQGDADAGSKVDDKVNHVTNLRLKVEPTPSSSSSSSPSEKRPAASRKVTFSAWYAAIQSAGERAVTGYERLWNYVESVQLPSEFVEMAWIKFKARYSSDPRYSRKKYVDWRLVFLSAVEGNWLRLWHATSDGYRLTTEGVQAQRELTAREEQAA